MWWKALALITFVGARFIYGGDQFDLNFVNSSIRVFVTDYFYKLELSIVRGDTSTQSVVLGTGRAGLIKLRKTARGFVLVGRGDEIEFAVEADERDYSQFSVSRRNIR